MMSIKVQFTVEKTREEEKKTFAFSFKEAFLLSSPLCIFDETKNNKKKSRQQREKDNKRKSVAMTL